MAVNMADITAKLSLNASDFTKGIREADKSLLGFAAGGVAIGNILADLGTMAANAALKLVSFPRAAAEAGAKYAEEIDHLSQRTGIASQTIEGFGVAMQRVGLTSDAIATSMRTLSQGMTDASSKAGEALLKIGVSADAMGKGTEAVLRELADRFSQMPDGAEKSRLAIEALGRGGLQLIPILNGGAKALDESLQKAREFGLVLSQTQRDDLNAFDTALDDMTSALKGFTIQVGAAFAPSFTALVNAMTSAVVYAKDIFNQFADAGEKLTVRIGAMVASLELLAKQLFSTSVLSKEAWSQTLEQVRAIDAWAAAQIKAIDSGTQLNKVQKDMNAAAREGVASQKALGEQIVSATKIMVSQAEERKKLAGAAQERMGKAIVSATQIELKAQAEAEAVRVKSEGAYQAFLAHKIIEESLANQKAEGNFQEYLGRKIVAETQANRIAEEHNQEHLGKFIVTQAIAAEKMRAKWILTGEELSQSLTFAFGQIRTQFGNTITNVILGTGKLSDIWKGFASLTLNTFIQLGLQMIANWFMTNVAMVTQSTATATTIGGIFAGLAGSIIGIFGTITGAIQGFLMETLIPMFIKIGTALMTFLIAIAEAAADTIFGIPYAVAILAGVAVIGAAIGAIAAFAFADGGIVRKPVLGMVGEAGPEAIVPLSRAGEFGLGGNKGATTIIVELDGTPILRHVADKLPNILRVRGLPA